MLYAVNVMTYVPAISGLKVTVKVALERLYDKDEPVSVITAVRLSVEIVGLAPPIRLVAVVSAMRGITSLVDTLVDKRAVTDMVSPPVPRNPWVKVIEAPLVEPAEIVDVAADRVNVSL
jgi:hypothetical protein